MKMVKGAARADARIDWVFDDLPDAEHKRLFAAADVCLAPSRWEGLGLHLYEATAFGMPIITNDNPPMNEVVRDGENGLLVRGIEAEEPADSGIPAYDPDVDELAAAIERLARPGVACRAARRHAEGPRAAVLGQHARGPRCASWASALPASRRRRRRRRASRRST